MMDIQMRLLEQMDLRGVDRTLLDLDSALGEST